MSVFSANSPLSPAQAKAYAGAVLGLLGSQNPLQVLRETHGRLQQDLQRIPRPQLGTPEAQGKWSARMVIAHLADAELLGSYHLRLVLAQDRPALTPFNQDEWAQRLYYDKADLPASLERFSVLRRSNLELWENAAPAVLMRVGIHAERGEENLEMMRRFAAGHDLVHLHQLARIRILITGQ